MKNVVTISLLAFALSGCNSTPEIANPMARFDSPEVHSDPFHLKLSVGYDSSNNINVDKQTNNGDGGALRASAAMSLGKGFEVNYTGYLDWESSKKFSLKYQWLGLPLEQSTTGNYSLATSIGRYTFTNSGFSEKQEQGRWDLEQKATDIAIIGGYRLNEDILLYSSLFYQKGQINGAYQPTPPPVLHTDKTVNTLCEKTTHCVLPFDSNGHSFGLSFAVEYQVIDWLALTGEFVHHKSKWFDRNNTESAINLNAELRF